MFVAEIKPAHIANLWLRLRSMFVRGGDIVGAAAALAGLASLTRSRQRQIGAVIARLETIARKLLLVQAAELHKQDAAAPQSSEPASRQVAARTCAPRQTLPFDPTQPQTWRTNFSLRLPRAPNAASEVERPSAAPNRQAKPKRLTPAPQRLALRLESVRRVIADPAPHARRLARALARLSRRFPRALELYALATARPHASDEGDPRLIIEAMTVAFSAAVVFLANTS